MAYAVNGIQQLGIGVQAVNVAWAWYRRCFGMDVPIFRDEAEAPFMTRYTGGAVHRRQAVLAVNLAGGAGFEIWQFTSREPAPRAASPMIGDTGILAGVMKCADVERACRHLRGCGATLLGDPQEAPDGRPRALLRDPDGNLFQLAPATEWFTRRPAASPGAVDGPPGIGGLAGVIIGTSDVEAALPLYAGLLGYDRVLYDVSGVFRDLGQAPGGSRPLRRVLLSHAPRTSAFSDLMGTSTLELVQLAEGQGSRSNEGRYWGDPGFIHLCFDVRGMDALREACAAVGRPFTVDSGGTFDMGDAGGRFAYVEDPDGTLIEFVETHRLPIVKAIGLSLDLRRRPPGKRLPRWMVRALGLARVRG